MPQIEGILTASLQLGVESILIRPVRKIGEFVAQVTLEEAHEDSLEITEHPVEMGAVMSDHAFKRPATVTIKCGWSNSPSSLNPAPGTEKGINSILTGNSVRQINQVYADLLILQESRIPFDVFTGKRAYSNMLVQSLRVETGEDTENSLIVTATLKQVVITGVSQFIFASPKTNQADPGVTVQTLDLGVIALEPAPNFNSTRKGL